MDGRIIPDSFSELLSLRSAVQAWMTVTEEVLEVLAQSVKQIIEHEVDIDELAAEYRGIYKGYSRILELIEERLFSISYPVYCELCLSRRKKHTLITFSPMSDVFSVCAECRKLVDDSRR